MKAILIFISLLYPIVAISCDKQEKKENLTSNWVAIEQIQFDWIKPANAEREQEIFVRAFQKGYENFSDMDLGIYAKHEFARLFFLRDAFKKEMIDFTNNPNSMWLLSVQLKKLNETKVIGFASFQTTNNSKEICIRQLTIDPEYWRNGIGKSAIFAIREKVNDIQKYVLVTRRDNKNACAFYEKIGFKRSEYMRAGLDPKNFIGYELNIK